MSNFICEHCGTHIVDSPDGYVTECAHYPKEPLHRRTLSEREQLILLCELGNWGPL